MRSQVDIDVLGMLSSVCEEGLVMVFEKVKADESLYINAFQSLRLRGPPGGYGL